MATDTSILNFLFDAVPEFKATFGNRRNWHRFWALAYQMEAALAMHRHAHGHL